MQSFLNLALALVFAAYAVADYNTVIADIGNLNTALSLITNDTALVTSGVSGIPFALKVSNDAVALDNLLIQTTKDVNASAPFEEPGSLDVSLAILELEPMIQSTLASLAKESATFGGLSPIVLSALYQLKEDTNAFGTAVTAKLELLEQLLAPGIIDTIDGYFNSAIVAYGGVAT